MRKISKDRWEGVKWRSLPEYNYLARWENLVTMRFDRGKLMELPADHAEFYDVGITTRCDAECPWCYVSATSRGKDFPNICETWKRWMATYPDDEGSHDMLTHRIFQCVIGACGEPTVHLEFTDFLKTVYESGVVPNYTTNGIALSYWNSTLSPSKKCRAREILAATAKYCGGVAVSMGDGSLSADRIKQACNAVLGLHDLGDCHIMMHHIISDKRSVDRFVWWRGAYGDMIHTHVLLPMVVAGRSTQSIEEGVFDYLQDTLERTGIKNVAFGAHFIDALKGSRLKTWLYPAETYSKNVLLQDGKVVITRSSFDLKPIKIINV